MDGRKLATVSQGNNNITYTYDVNGLRTSKTVESNAKSFRNLDKHKLCGTITKDMRKTVMRSSKSLSFSENCRLV